MIIGIPNRDRAFYRQEIAPRLPARVKDMADVAAAVRRWAGRA